MIHHMTRSSGAGRPVQGAKPRLVGERLDVIPGEKKEGVGIPRASQGDLGKENNDKL